MFYDYVITKLKYTEVIDAIGQSVKSYMKDFNINCDIQPSSSDIVKKVFGDDIESIFIVYCDDNLDIGTKLFYRGETYEINSKIDWIDYKIYSIKGCDVNVS